MTAQNPLRPTAGVDVILPCLNEAGALPEILTRMPSGYRPIVADNGSTDGSAAIAIAYGATVVNVPQRGFGAACHAGLLAASSDVVCVMDADGSFDPVDLAIVVGPVLDGSIDLMLGRRAPRGVGAWPLHARIGNAVLSAQLRRRAGIPLHDLGPMRAASAGWRIDEAPVPYYPRTGRSKVTGTVGGTVRTVRDMRRVLVDCAA